MTGRELATFHDIYHRICVLLEQKPDVHWLLGDFASDERYASIDLSNELHRFLEWHSDRPAKQRPKSHKLALRNWMRRVSPAPEPPQERRSLPASKPVPEYPDSAKAAFMWGAWLCIVAWKMDPHTYSTWLAASEGIGILPENDTVVVAVPNDTVRDYLPTICDKADHPLPFDVQFITAQTRAAHAGRSPAED